MQSSQKSIYDRLASLFSSLKLAVVLIMVLAVVSIIGTVVPQEREAATYVLEYGEATYRYLKLFGLVDLYHSWGFRVLVWLLGANLLVCSLRRLKGIYRHSFHPVTRKDESQIRALKISNVLPSPEHAGVIARVLEDKGYKVVREGNYIYGGKGALGLWGDMVTHLSILLILLGALVGSLGFVGTVNVYDGGSTLTHYNWNTGRDEPLGFELYLEKFTTKYYPIDVKVSVRDRLTGEKAGDFEAREGGVFSIPDGEYAVTPLKVDVARREVTLKIMDGEKLLGIYDTGLPDGGGEAPPLFKYTFTLTAFREPVIENYISTVRILRDGRVVKRAEIMVNEPLKFEGLTIYQSASGADDEGKPFSGFQIVRDPGVPIVWAGFVLMLAGLYLSLFYFHRQVWVYVGEDRVVVGGTTNKDLPGFMREYSGMIKRFMQEVEP
ncbi:MAG: cytochrome c biogenesis protein ResB [Nitrospirae bacterium]|nr:cytochrome c biogenesis protein ResB [Nitrospirota bacterium]